MNTTNSQAKKTYLVKRSVLFLASVAVSFIVTMYVVNNWSELKRGFSEGYTAGSRK
jgi:hypothetical protein